MSKTITMALADTLANMDGDGFKRFCRELRDRREEPTIRRNRVDGKDYLEITDVMVSTFTEEGARDEAIRIFLRMNCKAFAQALAKDTGVALPTAASGHTSQAGVAVAGPPGGAAAAPASAVGEYIQFLDKHRLVLINRVTNVDSILDKLLHHKVISQEVYCNINAVATNQGKIRAIYNGPLLNAEKCKQIFYQILVEEEPYLIEELKSL